VFLLVLRLLATNKQLAYMVQQHQLGNSSSVMLGLAVAAME
jgi:hypothetical protein